MMAIASAYLATFHSTLPNCTVYAISFTYGIVHFSLQEYTHKYTNIQKYFLLSAIMNIHKAGHW